MEKTELTGIERELVLQYLIDGNVPVTLTPLDDEEKDSSGEIKPATSAIFPVAFKAEKITVLEQGIILLKNPMQSVRNFAGKKVRVEFYFNRLGLCFETEVKEVKVGLALVIPSAIKRIAEIPYEKKGDFTATLYYSCNEKTDLHINCVPKDGYTLFERPVWRDIKEECSVEAKKYLEQFIAEARKKKTAGNGLQLIPVCRYIAEKQNQMSSIEGRANPLQILYIDYERIVFANSYNFMSLTSGTEYALEINFPIESSDKKTIGKRTVFVTCSVEDTYSDNANEFKCAVCKFTSMKEEDVRFLYEKTTHQIFA